MRNRFHERFVSLVLYVSNKPATDQYEAQTLEVAQLAQALVKGSLPIFLATKTLVNLYPPDSQYKQLVADIQDIHPTELRSEKDNFLKFAQDNPKNLIVQRALLTNHYNNKVRCTMYIPKAKVQKIGPCENKSEGNRFILSSDL